ncbi:MAG: CpaF/VirB11 family protein [Lachnospiraceae bacterium]|nr:CpaF/VirB11 family protein [Lachnospiraceae bacterium]
MDANFFEKFISPYLTEAGGTGSGKTTFLNALSDCIPRDERIITIEDSAELRIGNIKNLVRLEVRNKNSGECKEILIRDLIRTALRMRPDRIVVGEVRGTEAIDMLQAMATGHDGSLSTGHGNSVSDMLDRLETMILMGTEIPLTAVRKQISSAIDIMIHLGRLRDGSRKVLEISEVLGMNDGEIELNPLYVFKETAKSEGNDRVIGKLERTSNSFVCGWKLKKSGKEWIDG